MSKRPGIDSGSQAYSPGENEFGEKPLFWIRTTQTVSGLTADREEIPRAKPIEGFFEPNIMLQSKIATTPRRKFSRNAPVPCKFPTRLPAAPTFPASFIFREAGYR